MLPPSHRPKPCFGRVRFCEHGSQKGKAQARLTHSIFKAGLGVPSNRPPLQGGPQGGGHRLRIC